jgi:hypothetical protein
MWGRLVTCRPMLIGLLLNSIGMFNRPICNRRQVTNLPHIYEMRVAPAEGFTL